MASVASDVNQIGDDEIIRRKLLMDGDGMGDDRRLNMLLKMFLKWCQSKEDTDDENAVAHGRLLTTLAQVEFSMAKSQTVRAVNEKEMKNYENLYAKIETDIVQAQNNILECKTELQQAKRIRRNKQEYDALAKIIAAQPDRKVTMAKLEELGEKIRALEKTKEELDAKLEKRQKQFHVLLGALFELQQLVKEDAEDMEIS